MKKDDDDAEGVAPEAGEEMEPCDSDEDGGIALDEWLAGGVDMAAPVRLELAAAVVEVDAEDDDDEFGALPDGGGRSSKL